jgi:hypothetical protein
MSASTAQSKAPQALKLTAALAATAGALHQTLLAVTKAQGVNGAAWLDRLEAQFIRNTSMTGRCWSILGSTASSRLSNTRMLGAAYPARPCSASLTCSG